MAMAPIFTWRLVTKMGGLPEQPMLAMRWMRAQPAAASYRQALSNRRRTRSGNWGTEPLTPPLRAISPPIAEKLTRRCRIWSQFWICSLIKLFEIDQDSFVALAQRDELLLIN